MGQVIPFSVYPAAYPDLAADLSTADCVLLVAIRWWVEAYRAGDDPVLRLCQGLETAGGWHLSFETPPAGVHGAAFSIDGLMGIVARTGRRPVDVRCPRCPNLSCDEKQLLHAASLAQACDSPLAEKVLRATLLSAEGAAFAIGSLEGLGELFARARLFLTRCAPPAPDAEADDGRES